MEEEFHKKGILILRQVIDEKTVFEAVKEIWSTIEELPWRTEEAKIWQQLHKAFKPNYWKEMSTKESKIIKAHYPMTGGFGALTTPPFFHLQTQWDIRQNKNIVN